ncbi:hypothetical protein PTTG_29362 [Puccinia triticina 1-1 BBBD Race 1]|uniref:PH domain-containing protein n=2 Tax=Puccinia triticina TaxID=208348 RepID=A0A0C4EI05_PUCT1|nr:uncharacterized protein PtA15_8A464 [Puccinia triticina]OAV87610.1 hypothetical protein PTTG_29362 [Puccinia triticina 1-1 BBBD Race 1]WAQ87560.1 hypothetical protein PtA15_8A464 [Puccinia triticina]WAR57409.1 hypothetical protein PtB15_8B456 [Puccinia triticina]
MSKKPLSNLIIPQQQQQQQPDIHAINQALSSPINSAFPLHTTATNNDIESEDEEDDEHEQPSTSHYRQFGDIENEEILHSGYLLKKGERRKTWKRRWFVLRKTCLVYYKNEKEYCLLRIIPLTDIHTCAEVEVKQYDNTFGIVTPARTYYVRARSRTERNQWTSRVTAASLLLKSIENNPHRPTHPSSAPKPSSNPTTPSAITITNQPSYPSGLPPTPVCSPNQTTTNPISIVQPGEPSSSSSALSWASDHFNHLCHPSPNDNTATITKASIRRGLSLSAHQPSHPSSAIPSDSPTSYHHPPMPFRATTTTNNNNNLSSTGSSTGNNQQSSETSFATSQPPSHITQHSIPALMSSSEEDNEPDDSLLPPIRRATCGPNTHDHLLNPTDNLAIPLPVVPERKISLPEAGKTIIQGYLMKQGKRKNWRKRYFMLTSQNLVYSRTHMDVGGRHTRQIPIGRLLDAIEQDQPPDSPGILSGSAAVVSGGGGGGGGGTSSSHSTGPAAHEDHYFKIITSQRNYLLNAPTEDDEIRWISAVRCLLESYRANLPRSFDGILDRPIDT